MNKYDEKYWQDEIDKIMDWFDFERVHKCMVALDWVWARTNGIPQLGEIRSEARRLLKEHVHRKGAFSSTGGFEVASENEEGLIALKFVVEDWSNHD